MIWYDIMLYYIILYDIISYHTIQYNIILYYVILYYILYYIILYYIILCYVILYINIDIILDTIYIYNIHNIQYIIYIEHTHVYTNMCMHVPHIFMLPGTVVGAECNSGARLQVWRQQRWPVTSHYAVSHVSTAVSTANQEVFHETERDLDRPRK